MDSKFQMVTLHDGRVVEVLLGGRATGLALVMHHGTPGEMSVFSDWHSLCEARGVRLVCMSRPGYAASSRRPRRSVADAAADVASVLTELGCDTFATLGWSGGGPHALACASLLADRCVAAATMGGVGAYGAHGLDFLAGMGPENVAEFGAALAGEEALRRWLETNTAALRTITADALAEALGGLVAEVDKSALVGRFAEQLAASVRRSISEGLDGWIDDDLAFVRPWGFEPMCIRVPVTVWQGEFDLMVPTAHGRWLADRIPGSQRRFLPGHGHLSLVKDLRADVLDQLLHSAAA
jgi:pimeloyl-ACP methyl ester carboxylesterase